jgi:hypothetical protein
MTPEEIQNRTRNLQSMLQDIGIGNSDADKSFDEELKPLELAFSNDERVAAIRHNFDQLLQRSGAMRDRTRLNLGITIAEFQKWFV